MTTQDSFLPCSLETWQQWRASLPPLPQARLTGEHIREALIICQQGTCALCLAPGPGSTLVVDHEHPTGLVRGLICQSCNLAEGRTPAGHDPVIDAYRANPPAAGTDWTWGFPGQTATPHRFILDLEPELHRFLKRFALDTEADASVVLRTLLNRLRDDAELAQQVQADIWETPR